MHADISDEGQPGPAESIFPTGVLMFHVQRLTVRLASHALPIRVALCLWTGADAVVRNHDQKIKDMSRSVLPSTRRKTARDDRRMIHKQQRTRELAAVTAYRRATDPDGVTPDLRGTYTRDITNMVWDRRNKDKLGPLIRWAEATIAAEPVLRSAPRAEQVANFARLMPDTTTGRHAVQHIESALSWREHCARDNASSPAGPGPYITEMERQLGLIIEAGLHAALNTGLRRLADTQQVRPPAPLMPRRLLLGSHDIEPFTTTMARWPAVRDLVAALAATGLARTAARGHLSWPG